MKGSTQIQAFSRTPSWLYGMLVQSMLHSLARVLKKNPRSQLQMPFVLVPGEFASSVQSRSHVMAVGFHDRPARQIQRVVELGAGIPVDPETAVQLIAHVGVIGLK